MTNPISKSNNKSYYYNDKPNYQIYDFDESAIEELNEPYNFHKSLNQYNQTPVIKLSRMSNKLGVSKIYVKDEAQRFGLDSFKVLGVSYAVNKILEFNPKIEVFISATEGNHGKALAWVAKLNHKKAIIYVPKNTSINRIKAIKKLGASVIKCNTNYEDTCLLAQAGSKKNNWALVQDTSWGNYFRIPNLIMAGYSTMMYEVEQQIDLSKIDFVFLQAGVGSWAASIINYFQTCQKQMPKIIIVEPYQADGILNSLKKNSLSKPTGAMNSKMAGLNCGTPSKLAFETIRNNVTASIKIEDYYSINSMKELFNTKKINERIISGESGVAGLAGLTALMTNKKFEKLRRELDIGIHSNVLCFNTEGATDRESFGKIVGIPPNIKIK